MIHVCPDQKSKVHQFFCQICPQTAKKRGVNISFEGIKHQPKLKRLTLLLEHNECTLLTVAPGEVSALDHEVADDPVEVGADVAFAARPGLVALGLLAESLEVVHSPGDGAAEEADLDHLGSGFFGYGDLEENLIRHLGPVSGRDLASAAAAEAGHCAVDDSEHGQHLHGDLQDSFVATEKGLYRVRLKKNSYVYVLRIIRKSGLISELVLGLY